jgi:RNA polymerase sigma-70 factor (ECF subfamily)
MDERQQLIKLQQGNERVYKDIFMTYYSPLCEYASQYVLDNEAEDVVQDLMLFLWESREMLVIDTSLKSYLFTAVKNRCLNMIKKKLYHERVHNALHEKLTEHLEDPDYYVINKLSSLIEEAIRGLPEKYRETFLLSRFGELSNLQIAGLQENSVKTVEYRITQSLKILRVKLKDYLPLIAFLF